MAWSEVQKMLAGLGRVLAPSAPFLLYGPFQREGRHTAASNAKFHAALRARDPQQGLRSIEMLESEARRHHLHLQVLEPMPANNFTAVFYHEE